MLLQFREISRPISFFDPGIEMDRKTIRIQFCLLLMLTLPAFLPVSSNLMRCLDYNHLVDSKMLSWKDRELCRNLALQTALISGRYPHRVLEGKGHARFLSRRIAELICDFQQPRGIISNVIWHKVTRPTHSNYDLYEKNAFVDVLYNNGIPQNPFHYPKIYAVSRPAGSSLFIQDVSPRDFGIYRCFATRYAIPFTYKYPQLMTVYQDVEFYPRHLQYKVLEK